MKKLVVNVLLFPILFLPAAAVAALAYEGLFGDLSSAEPGTNPILWLIYTAPWIAPAIVMVPIVHVGAGLVARRTSRASARWSALLASPVLFAIVILVLWGPRNFTVSFVSPVVIAGIVYGAVFRIPGRPTQLTRPAFRPPSGPRT